MTHRLADTTRTVAFAAAGTAVVAAADLLDRQGGSTTALLAAVALVVAALLLARTREVALVVAEDRVELRGLLGTRTLDRADVVGVTASHWNSFIELRDGRSVMTLLRAEDLQGLDLSQPVVLPEAAPARQRVNA